MIKSTINTKYQVVLPKEIRKRMPEIKPGAKVIIEAGYDNTVLIKVLDNTKSWTDRVSESLDENVYGKDPDKYIQNLRESWGKRKLPWKD